jgi:GAF domain-containing protein
MADERRARADVSEFSRLAATITESRESETAFSAINAAANRFIGHRLFTIMAFDPTAMEVQRLYSSDPDSYPPGDRKSKGDSEWSRRVLQQGLPYIGRNADDIRAHFNDHALILGLGMESVLNMPVRCCGRTIGTLNLLNEAGYFHEDDLIPGRLLAALTVGPLRRL